MTKLHAVVRIDKKTKRAILFYRCDNNDLECYTLEEQHSGASQQYYNDDTRPAGSPNERVQCFELARHYGHRLQRYDDIELEVGQRLRHNS